MKTSYVCDQQWFRTSGGRGVLAGSPLTQFTVTDKGAAIFDALETATALPDGHEPLTDRLVAKGAIHPCNVAPVDPGQVTIVIPAYITHPDHVQRLQRLVSALQQHQIIVVNDASPIAFTVTGATIIHHQTNQGPGPSRNTGLAQVSSPYVAFVDEDVTATSENLCRLAGYLSTNNTSLIAPRVRSAQRPDALGEYEWHHSPLDLGEHPAVVRSGSRVSYVPSAVLVAHVNVLRQLDGFDESFRTGEDVDLVWRASENNLVCRYAPDIVCHHLARPNVRAFVSQRFQYGKSAAHLASRHSTAATPLRTHLALLIPPVALFLGFAFEAMFFLLVMYGWFAVSLRTTRLSIANRCRVVSVGAWATTQLLTRAVARSWWPLFVFASGLSTRLFLMFTVCVLVPPMVELVAKRPKFPPTFLGLHILDNFSYGAGVWVGVFRARSLQCIRPVITMSSRRLRSQG